jgi:DNA processing protein
MNKDVLYQIALTLVPNLGVVYAKLLLDYFGNAENIFKAKFKDLCRVEGIGVVRAKAITDFNNFKEAEEEIKFIEKHHIQTIIIGEDNYPKRLLHCYDAPTILFYRGNVDLNTSKILSIIGTRSNTEYGKQVTQNIIEQLQPFNVLIVSGLAFGIDAIAHKAAMQNNLPTIGVLAHGLKSIYPSLHKNLAKEMLLNGGLLTEFKSNTKADRFNFPQRNRIVAGMADATIVIETDAKGGSMITAEMAYNYNKDVFAVPGKIYDNKSSGCLNLVQQNKAILLSNPQQIITELGWQTSKKTKPKQKELFIEFTSHEKVIVELLKQSKTISIDELFIKSGLSSSSVAAALLNLEMQNIVTCLPGKQYKLDC